MPSPNRSGFHLGAQALFQRHEGAGMSVFRPQDRALRSTAKIVGQEYFMIPDHVAPDRVCLVRQDRDQVRVEGLQVPDVDWFVVHALLRFRCQGLAI